MLAGLLRLVVGVPDEIVFGLMHRPAVGFAVPPGVAVAYPMVAGFLLACTREEGTAPGWVNEGVARVAARLGRKPTG